MESAEQRDFRRNLNKALQGNGLAAGAAIDGVATLCDELRATGGLSEEAISRIEKSILAGLTGGMGHVSKVPDVSRAVERRFAQGRPRPPE